MKVKAIKLFGDGKRLYNEGEIFEQTKEWVDTLNSTPDAPLVEVLETPSKGADINGHSNSTKPSKGTDRNKNNS